MRWMVTIGCGLLMQIGTAQHGYFDNWGHESRYYVGIGYGVGETNWYSRTVQYDLQDMRGHTIYNGNSELRTSNRYHVYQLDVLGPVWKLRMGLGINFEFYDLRSFDLEASNYTATIPFVETFRFDKVYAQFELPLYPDWDHDINFGVNMKTGYYGFSKVNNRSLFGASRLGRAYFLELGVLTDVKVYDRTYLYVMPAFDYKYFNNPKHEHPSAIFHNLISYKVTFGVRVHVL